MKCLFLFLSCVVFGFFDFLFFLFFLVFFMIFMFMDFGAFWFGGIFFSDSLSFFLLYLTILVFFFCFFSNLSDMWYNGFFYGYVFVVGSIFILLFFSFFSLSVFFFYICFETIFMFMFFFVMIWGYSPERIQASFYMVFYTIVVSFPFLVYIVTFENTILSMKFGLFYNFSFYWWFFLFFVFLVKLPVYGVHLWLPKAHVEAPVSGSMVLAGVLLKLGAYGFLRFLNYAPLSLLSYSGYLFSIGLGGGLYSCFFCLRQSDLKSFVAYSSVCHMGFGLAGIFSYSYYGMVGGLYMMIGHGFCSSCLFYILYVLYKRFHTRSLLIMKGTGFLFPSIVLVWFIFSIINMGVPPSFSFFSEICILSGVVGFNFFSGLFSGIFLFLAGVYGIFLFVVSSHGFSLMEGMLFSVSVREYLLFFGHFFPLVFISLYLGFFFV